MGDSAFRDEDLKARKVVTLSPLVKGFAGELGLCNRQLHVLTHTRVLLCRHPALQQLNVMLIVSIMQERSTKCIITEPAVLSSCCWAVTAARVHGGHY